MSLLFNSKFFSMMIFGFIIAASAQTQADIILDTGTFSNSEPSGGGFVVATSQFSLAAGDIPNIRFESNYDFVDAGVQINVNNMTLFSTGDDVSNFGPLVFASTPVQPNNIDFSFSPNDNGLPRLTVVSDSSGTAMSGAAFVNSTNTVDYIPLFSVADFTSLLQPGNNTIEIVNLNSYEGANLAGDFTVTLVEATPAPEPTSLVGLMALAASLSLRRRRS